LKARTRQADNKNNYIFALKALESSAKTKISRNFLNFIVDNLRVQALNKEVV
jgi:hypothetical protein